MIAKISRSSILEGEIISSPSKSYSHRALFLGILRKEPLIIENLLDEGDVGHTIEACKFLGAKIEKIERRKYKISPSEEFSPSGIRKDDLFDCGNSGTTVRILTALSILAKTPIKLTGTFFDRNRPIDELLTAMENLGTLFKKIKNSHGDIIGIEIFTPEIIENVIKIRGDISSQFITGLIIAGCGLAFRPKIAIEKGFYKKEFIIETTTAIKSFPYIQITEEIVKQFNIPIKITDLPDKKIRISINLNLNSTQTKNDSNLGTNELEINEFETNEKNNLVNLEKYIIPGDFSSAAFIIAAAALFGTKKGVLIRHINTNSPQGDKEIINILIKMGAHIIIQEDSLLIQGRDTIFDQKTGEYIRYLNGITINCSNIPDLFPILTVIGMYAKGETSITNAEHVRLKETDRVSVMVRELFKFSKNIREYKDGCVLSEDQNLSVTGYIKIHTEKDHRIIMAMSIFALGLYYSDGNVQIYDSEYVKDSYPDFFEHLKKLNAIINLN